MAVWADFFQRTAMRTGATPHSCSWIAEADSDGGRLLQRPEEDVFPVEAIFG